MDFSFHSRSILIILQMMTLAVCFSQVKAHTCEVGQEKHDGEWIWVLATNNPCECTRIVMGGRNTIPPKRSFEPVFAKRPLISHDTKKIRHHFNLKCEGQDNKDLSTASTPSDLTESDSTTAIVPQTSSTTNDNSGSVTLTSSHDSGDRVTSSSISTTKDNEDLSVASTPSKNTRSGFTTAIMTRTSPTTSDNSGSVTPTSFHDSGDIVTTTSTSTIKDKDNPSLSKVPSDIKHGTDKCSVTAVVNWTSPTASDNSGEVTLTSSHKSGDAFPIGDTTVTYTAADTSGNHARSSFTVTIEANIIKYDVTVYTGDKASAGTNARVYLTLFGANNKASKEFQLDTPGNGFERASIDEFIVEDVPLGDLQKIRIRHDNSGYGPGWYIDKVTVRELDICKQYQFICNCWLASGTLEKDISVEEL